MSPFQSTSLLGVATDHSKQTKHPAELGERTEKAEGKGLEAVEMAQRENLSLDFQDPCKNHKAWQKSALPPVLGGDR